MHWKRLSLATGLVALGIVLAWVALSPSTVVEDAPVFSPEPQVVEQSEPRPSVAPTERVPGTPISPNPEPANQAPQDTAQQQVAWPDDLPEEYLPASVYDAVQRSERLCFARSTTTLEVDCQEFPCLVASLSEDGVVSPFCEEAHAPPFPWSWMAVGSPISPNLDRFSKVQPMLPDSWLEDDTELRERIRHREWMLTKEWIKN
jgi:hypothetical protein